MKNKNLPDAVNSIQRLVGDTGFEPVTSTMSMWRSNQLS